MDESQKIDRKVLFALLHVVHYALHFLLTLDEDEVFTKL